MIITVSIPPGVRSATPFITPLSPAHRYSLPYSLFQCDSRKQPRFSKSQLSRHPQNHTLHATIEEINELRKVLAERKVME